MSTLPDDASQPSSTVEARDLNLPEFLGDTSAADLQLISSSPRNGDEYALESHEVIELQTFSERKAWIEQKIRFLEKMPPVEVFVGLDAIQTSAEQVPGLPTREELKHWLAEHDAIEKETEIFDRGELTKLRNLTKAATQRNLSSADTDVIELTLTTIYELDKLLHLLRNRSENLELLGIRLTWEEFRSSAWVDRRNILEDLRIFLDTRARWNPSAYDSTIKPDEPHDLKRRASVTSMASTASDSSVTSRFSRSTRFKLAELLSRDAALFAGRVTSLRHSKITAAGKILDKLIENSRKPVPEVLLDEQDRLEEKGITELEHIGKFAMNLVMQWRKADEIYVETMKDTVSAQNLLEEIETAKLHHPTARQSVSFVSRADALLKRLALRGNPASSSSTFPCPEHPLFPDQQEFNRNLIESLDVDITSAIRIARKVDATAKAYRTAHEAVKQVEDLITAAGVLSATFTSIITRLQEGVSAGDGDGSPLNLMSETCLDLSRHSAFLALLPSILEESAQAAESSGRILEDAQSAILSLDHPGVDTNFTTNAVSEFQRLASLHNHTQDICKDMKDRYHRLRQARRIWTAINKSLNQLEHIRQCIEELMENKRWRQLSGQTEEIPTPESRLISFLPTEASSAGIIEELVQLRTEITHDIDTPFTLLSETLELPLKLWLLQTTAGLKGLLDMTTKMANLLESIQRQADVMQAIHQEFNVLKLHMEDAEKRIESCIDDVLAERLANGSIPSAEDHLLVDMKATCAKVKHFTDRLTERTPFVYRHSDSYTGVHRHFTSADLKSDTQSIPIELPFDLVLLDDAVRADSNQFAMKLNGKLDSLSQAITRFQLTCAAKEVDLTLSATIIDINTATQELSSLKSALSDTVSRNNDVSTSLDALMKNVEMARQEHQTRIMRSFSIIHQLLHKMKAASSESHITSAHSALYNTRRDAVGDAETHYKDWCDDISAFKDEILYQQQINTDNLEQLRVAEEKHHRAVQEHLAAEEVEKFRLVEERLVLEEKQRLEEERRAEDLRKQAELDKIAAEETERARVEQGHVKMEDSQWIATECLATEHQLGSKNNPSYPATIESTPTIEHALTVDEEDVFGMRLAPSKIQPKGKNMSELQSQILTFRKRLRAININEIARPAKPSTHLPDSRQLQKMTQEFSIVSSGVALLPGSATDHSIDTELRSLRAEVEASDDMMKRVEKLVHLAEDVSVCDAALSDLLEHIDSYPALPKGFMASSHRPLPNVSPEDQFSARLSFTRTVIENITSKFMDFIGDSRAEAEKARILQTWSELEEMGNDRLIGKKSRPGSTISSRPSSGRNSSASILNTRSAKKIGAYSNLSVSSTSSHKRLPIPSYPTPRRVVSGSAERQSRPTSQLSNLSSNRSVSGPLGLSIYSSTFASRQRTSSLSTTSTPTKHTINTPARSRAQTGQTRRPGSPSGSDASSYSHSIRGHSRTSTSTSSWSRAPRNSLSSLVPTIRDSTPRKKTVTPRRTYVADPKNKLDVAVGDVVNKLPVGINVESISETWKDQSGKYWIGNQDPKLCFCRILRSQTVMVRVGGGWSELSKFIKDHFADSFRLMPDSPPRPGAPEEKWISSATLLEAPEFSAQPVSPRTPEPVIPFVPSFSISTPSGQSPRSMKSTTPSTKGSPLTPLQFIRRADVDAMLRPVTPSKPPALRPSNTATHAHTQARNSIWRP